MGIASRSQYGKVVLACVRTVGRGLGNGRGGELWRAWHEDQPDDVVSGGTIERVVHSLVVKIGNDRFVKKSGVSVCFL